MRRRTIITLEVPWDDEGDGFFQGEDHPSLWDWDALLDTSESIRVVSWKG
jgi:hypothetical protein